MSNFIHLVKIQTSNLLLSSTRMTRRKGKQRIGVGILVLMILILLGLSSFYSLAMLMALKGEERQLALYTMSFLTFILLVVFAVYNSGNHFFGGKDYDLLCSMPISKRAMVASKLLSFLSLQYIYAFFLLIPAILLYGVFTSQTLLYYLGGIGMFLVLPMPAVILSALFSLLAGYVSSHFKYKNLVSNVLMMLFVFVVFFGSFALQTVIGDTVELSLIIHKMQLYLPFFSLMIKGMVEQDLLSYLLGLLTNVLPFILFVLFFSKSFARVNQRLRGSYREKHYTLSTIKQSSSFQALFMKEVRRYFACGIYVMNTAFGPVIMLGGALFALMSKQGLSMLLSELPIELTSKLGVGLAICFMFMIMMSCTTNSSISLEGRHLWITKSLPVQPQEVFAAKIALNLIIVCPAALLSMLLFSYLLSIHGIAIVLLLILVVLLSLFTACFGLIVNLNFPRFDWISETTVVKQSMASMISIFGGMILTGLVAFITLQIIGSVSEFVYLGLINVFFMLLVCGCLVYLNTVGAKLFKQL